MSDVQHRLVFTPGEDDDWRCSCGQWTNRYGDDPDAEFAKHRAWVTRIDGNTPTLEQWRESFRKFLIRQDIPWSDDLLAEFDRMIAAHDAQIKAEALRKAARFQTDPDFEFTNLAVVRDWLLDLATRIDGGGKG